MCCSITKSILCSFVCTSGNWRNCSYSMYKHFHSHLNQNLQRATVICQHTKWLQFIRNTENSQLQLISDRWALLSNGQTMLSPQYHFLSFHTMRHTEISCLFFLEWFCVAILCNVTLHTCNIHIHEITALNTTIIIMTIINGQQ